VENFVFKEVSKGKNAKLILENRFSLRLGTQLKTYNVLVY